MDLLGVKLQRVLGELESLLDQRLEFTDSSSLVTEDFLGVGGSDNDLGSGVGNSDLTSRVSLLGELSGAVLVSHCLLLYKKSKLTRTLQARPGRHRRR